MSKPSLNNKEFADSGIVFYYGLYNDNGSCGYCKESRRLRESYSFDTSFLTAEMFELLIQRNFRRSGTYIYKPNNPKHCCPAYAIRLDVTKLKLSNSQKKVIKRFNNFIKYDIKPTNFCKKESQDSENTIKKQSNQFNDSISNEITYIKTDSINSSLIDSDENFEVEKSSESRGLKLTKKKYLRRKKLVEKIMKRENCDEEKAQQMIYEKSLKKQKTKSIEDFMNEINCDKPRHRFRTEIILTKSKNDRYDEIGFNLFKSYQLAIHKDSKQIKYNDYVRFLVNTPILTNQCFGNDNLDPELPKDYGTYHVHYYIDNKLIAISVIDLLPFSLSSVYALYDPDFEFLNLGTFTALYEIYLLRRYQKVHEMMKYYYMGYYIHKIPKMRYKAKFRPSELLCSETFRWFDINECIKKLDTKDHARFCDDPEIIDDDGIDFDVDQMTIYPINKGIGLKKYSKYKMKDNNLNLKSNLESFCQLVGKKICYSLIFTHFQTSK